MTSSRSVVLLLVFGLSALSSANGQHVLRHLVVYEEAGEYLAWPSIARTGSGDLLVFFCRTDEHLGPDGAILASRSTDKGTTWLPPQIVAASTIDDRECGVTTLANGTLLVHLWSTCFTPDWYDNLPPKSYTLDVLEKWKWYVSAEKYQAARDEQGAWGRVSTDGGYSWSGRLPSTDAVHGGIQLHDGTLLCASYRNFRDSIGVLASPGPSGPWTLKAGLTSPRPDSISLGEPHLVQLPGGRICMMIRATAKPYDDTDRRCVLWESTSDDGGTTWAPPSPTPLWGYPPHLLLLSDGRVLCTYGYRRPPYGQRACISNDGIHWDPRKEIALRNDAPNGDLGYPASIEIAPDTILTVYYQPNVPPGTVQQMKPPDPHRKKPAILGTLWTVR